MISLPAQFIYRIHDKEVTILSLLTSSLSHNKCTDLSVTLPESLYNNWDIVQYYRITDRHIVVLAKHKETNICHVLTIIHNSYFHKKLWKDLIRLPDSKLLLPHKIHASKDIHILEFPVCTPLKKLVQTKEMSLSQIISLIMDLSASLNCLHNAGILHMDISVDNIYLTEEQHFILGDFSESCYQTEAAYPLFDPTPPFTAPECQKEAPSKQSEQYQLGILFYQLCNLGNAPPKDFQGIVPQNLPVFQSAPNISDTIKPILSKMLAQDPVERYSDLTALHQDLNSISTEKLEQSDYQLFLPDETHSFHQTLTLTRPASTKLFTHSNWINLPSLYLPFIHLPLQVFLFPLILGFLLLIFLFAKGFSFTGNKAKQIMPTLPEQTTTGSSIIISTDKAINTDAILDIADKNIDSLASAYPKHIHANAIHTLLAENNHISSLHDLSFFPNLREIYLSNNQITDLQDLATLSNLEIIVLSDNQCTDISDLKTLHKLRFLDLSGNSELSEINDLHTLISLETLILSDTSVTEDAVKQLQQTLPKCNIIF